MDCFILTTVVICILQTYYCSLKRKQEFFYTEIQLRDIRKEVEEMVTNNPPIKQKQQAIEPVAQSLKNAHSASSEEAMLCEKAQLKNIKRIKIELLGIHKTIEELQIQLHDSSSDAANGIERIFRLADEFSKFYSKCPVCLECITKNDFKLECGHVMHQECFQSLVTQTNRCPICNQEDTRYTVEDCEFESDGALFD